MNEQILRTVRSHRTILPVFLLLGILTLAASACGLGSSPVATSAPMEQPVSESQGGDSISFEDILAMNVCEIFPGEAVASALGATLSDPSNPGSGSGGPDCTYGLIIAGASGTQLYFINLADPEMFDLGLGALVDAQPLEGFGSDAFGGTRVGTDGTYEIQVRNIGGISIDVLGPDAALVRTLTEYVIANLP